MKTYIRMWPHSKSKIFQENYKECKRNNYKNYKKMFNQWAWSSYDIHSLNVQVDWSKWI